MSGLVPESPSALASVVPLEEVLPNLSLEGSSHQQSSFPSPSSGVKAEVISRNKKVAETIVSPPASPSFSAVSSPKTSSPQSPSPVRAAAAAAAATDGSRTPPPQRKLSRKEEKRLKRLKIGTLKSGVRAGDYGSEEDPLRLCIGKWAPSMRVAHNDEAVIPQPVITVIFTFPFSTTGPTKDEVDKGGWGFRATAPDGHNYFTYHDLANFVCRTYKSIYEEEELSTEKKYGIFGKKLDELFLTGISYDPETKVATLDVQP